MLLSKTPTYIQKYKKTYIPTYTKYTKYEENEPKNPNT